MSAGIRRQLILYFVFFAFALGALFAGVTLLVFHRVEDRMIERRLELMVSSRAARPDGPAIAYVGPPEQAPAPLADRLRGLTPGKHEWEEEDSEIHALLLSGTGSEGETVALASFSESERTETRFVLALVSGVLATSLVALALARTLAVRIVSPIERLTEQLAAGSFHAVAEAELAGGDRSDELGTLARALRRASREQIAAMERERRFLREASHELRTPITVIQGVADLLHDSEAARDPTTRQRLDRLQRGLRRMHTAVLSLLAMARAEHRSLSTKLPPLAQQVQDLVEEARALAGPDVEIRLDLRSLPADGPEAPMLVVVLSNLARNAAQHTRAGNVRVILESTRAQVLDTGPGLPPPILRQLQAGGPSPDLGIGLATVVRICRRFGWHLDVSCPDEGGTRITVELAPPEPAS